jgi:hypothetical protein
MNNLNRTYSDSKGNSTQVTSYEMLSVDITNNRGVTRDIRNMVGFTKIHESLLENSLVLEMGIRDEVNFFEEFGITGNEYIDLKINVTALDVVQEIDLRFYIVTYEDFVKGKDQQVQVYTFTAVSEFAYIAPLKNISRYVSGSTASTIKRIFMDDLNWQRILIEGNCQSSFDGIINICNPLEAVDTILSQSFDDNNTPFLCFQRLNGFVTLASLSDLTSKEVYKEFIQQTELESNPNTPEEFYERSTQMKNLSSKISLAPSYQATDGVYASENRYIDIGTKTFRTHIFNAEKHLKAENTTAKRLTFADSSTVSDKRRSETAQGFNRIPSARINTSVVNRHAYNGFSNIADLREQQKHLSNAYLYSYDTCTHTFEVMGDPLLNPGRICKLLFPKATDPAIYKEYTDKSITETYDTVLSGNYMVFSAVHNFVDGKYTTELTMKTDSLNQEII